MESIIEKVFTQIEKSKFYYKIFYFFVSLTFVTVLEIIPHINILSKISLAWGLIICVYTVFSGYKKRKIYQFDISLMCFMAVTLVFTVLFYRTGSNIKTWIINCIIFLSIYTIDIFKSKKEIVSEVSIIANFFTGFMAVISAVSLIMKISGATIKAGEYVFEGAKGGLFENKNAMCIAAAIALALCVYLNYSIKEYKMKMYYLGNIVLQLIVILTFRGRSSFLIVAGMIFTTIFVYCSNKYIRGAMIILPVIVMGILYLKLDYNYIRLFTSGRINLWNSASMVIKTHPLVGVGGSGMLDSIYKARVTFDLPGIKYGGLHNIYFQIAAVNGLISLAIFLSAIIMMMIFIVNKIDELKRKEKARMTVLFSMLVGILAVNMFESSLIYIISYISITFWIFSGYLISMLDNKNFN